MKILAIGDFHGKFSIKLIKKIKKENPDLIVSLGDYFPFIYRKIWFEHCYGKETELWEVIGKQKVKKLVEKDLKIGGRILKELNKMPIPVFTVIGNLDYTNVVDVYDPKKTKKKKRWRWYEQDFFSKIIKKYKNIKRFDYSYFKFKDFVFIGAFGHTFPGKVKSKNYKKYRAKLERLFKQFNKENKKGKTIFVAHNVPYKTKVDKIKSKDAPKTVRGKHYGSKLIRRLIDKYHPILCIGGHIHESWGIQKLNKTLIINPGAAVEGRAAIIDTRNNKKVKVRFIKA